MLYFRRKNFQQLKLAWKDASFHELEPYDILNLDDVFGIEVGSTMTRGRFVFDTKVCEKIEYYARLMKFVLGISCAHYFDRYWRNN